MSERLKPCPFCGSTEAIAEQVRCYDWMKTPWRGQAARLVTAAQEAVFGCKHQTPRAMLVRGHAVAVENEIPDLSLPDAEIEKREKAIEDEAASWHELASKLDALHAALRALEGETP